LIAQSKNFKKITPFVQWRQNCVMTAGLIRMGLKIFFRHFGFCELWNPKSKKLILPIKGENFIMEFANFGSKIREFNR